MRKVFHVLKALDEMSHKRFYLRLVLHLHAVTCPGVWLCSHGYLEATVKTLGYYFRTGAMEPRFPLLCHDDFTMEGYFRTVNSLEQMRQMLNGERLEITLWQSGRRLAYFVGRLSDLMQPPIPRPTCAHSSNVQLLMTATSAFPGIIAPKVELSAELNTWDKEQRCCEVDLQRPISNRHAESYCLSRLEMPRKQKTVCHSKNSTCNPTPSRTSSRCFQHKSSHEGYEPHGRRLSMCSSSTELSNRTYTFSIDSNTTQHTQLSTIGSAEEHERNCSICQAYRRLEMYKRP